MALGESNLSGVKRIATPYVFVLPALLYLLIFMFWPLARQLWMSLTDTTLINPNVGDFVGLKNYALLLADEGLYNSLTITLIFTLGAVVFCIAVGLVAALAIDRPFHGRPIARAILLFGWAIPNVAAALIWLWMYNEQSGVFNGAVSALGLGRVHWLTSMDVALVSVLAVHVWHTFPFVMLVILAALQSVPEEAREAARIDGADALNVFRAVTFPHIRPTVQLVALLVAVWSIRLFDLIYLLTGGGPLDSTKTIVVKLRQVAFEDFDLGLAGAYGAIGLILALLVGAAHYVIDQRRMKLMAQ